LELVDNPKSSDEVVMVDGEKEKVKGTGSGFIWDKFSDIVDVKGIEVKPVDG
ncbi:hypothetical protein Tco_0241041, partial [Tanacetum coccineum]